MDLQRTGSLDNHKYLKILDNFNDKSFIYSVLLTKSARYYNVLKHTFAMPLIITSSILSILNGSIFDENDKYLKIINTVFNITTALVLSINNTFQFETKSNDFKNNAIKFQKLSHLIESKVLEGEIHKDFIDNITNTYDNLVESIMFDIPHHICRKTRSEYAKKKWLPVIINGIPKEDHVLFTDSSPMAAISPLRRLSASLGLAARPPDLVAHII